MQNINLNCKYVCIAVASLFLAIPGLNAQEIFFLGGGDAELPESDAGLYQDELQSLEPDEQPENDEFPVFESSKNGSKPSIYVRGGGGDASVYSLDLTLPLGDSFDLDFRGAQLVVEKDFERRVRHTYHYYSYYYTYRYRYSYYGGYSSYPRLHKVSHYYSYYSYYTYTVEQKSTFGSLVATWKPLKNSLISPYFGAGICYTSQDYNSDYDYWEDAYSRCDMVAKIGVAFNISSLTMKCEYVQSGYSKELIGDVGISIGDSLKLHVFVEQVDLELTKSMSYGGGLEFSF